MNRARLVAAVLLAIGAMLPTDAPAQNLEAGKSPGQLFNNTCTACHRSPRGLLRTVAPGSLPGFLREHYTTSRDMAQQLSGFLISNGATDTRGRPQETRQQPAGAEPPRQQRPSEPEPPQQARPRQPEPEQQPRPQRPIEQEQAARPPEPQQSAPLDPREAARLARREKRAKREAERAAASLAERDAARRNKDRPGRVTPARIDAASARGKDALPLGSLLQTIPPAEVAKPEVAASPAIESAKPATPPPSETSTRADPVPQVTPAPPVAETPTGSSAPELSQRSSPGLSSGSDDKPVVESAPAVAEPSPPSAPEAPPKPPISN